VKEILYKQPDERTPVKYDTAVKGVSVRGNFRG
jgi:hypothetical protein